MVSIPSNFDLAVEAYREHCDRANIAFQSPSEEFSQVSHNVVYLRVTPTGYVGRYSVSRRKMLA